ncbi:hypothetical protein BDA99DRAFT_554592 [Phascolomyces articulosus]|uniref:WKF domain-containing protein n=1 Tax=Phascolomyces articulosus TaxID=60185 RepID=A0AAD5PN17_9FUNG|nr:hypothetical protein BDA99DRAFT_554592 [Phascolomyces articulosus]
MATEDVVKKSQKKDKKEKKEKKSSKKEKKELIKEKEEVTTSETNSKEEKKKKKEKKRKAREDEDAESNKKPKIYVPDGIQYLRTFHSDKNEWKFKKMSQVWCLQHMYDENVMKEDDFKIMLDYMKDMKGQARTKTLREAQDKIPPEPTDVDNDVFDAEAALNAVPISTTPETSSQQEDEGHEDDTPMIKRARAIVKVLIV